MLGFNSKWYYMFLHVVICLCGTLTREIIAPPPATLIDIGAHGQLLQKFHVVQCKFARARTKLKQRIEEYIFFLSNTLRHPVPLYARLL